MSETTTLERLNFACPKCKRALRSIDNALFCDVCNRTYPIVGGIPDLLLPANLAPATQRLAKVMDLVAPIYESPFFVSLLVGLSGIAGGAKFMDRIAKIHSDTLKGISGSILDVACGPATYTRRTASSSREVYGIDVSMGVLQQGLSHIAQEGVPGVHLARASVEELPFENAVFDGAVCSGSLHLFPDTVLALREIARTLKPGALLSVQTFVHGNTTINRFMQKRSWLHTFQLPKLQQDLTEAGFQDFQPKLDGIVLTFSARKA